MPSPNVGDPAPDFTLPGVHDGRRREYTLSEFRGGPVALAFYPGDFTAGCTRQFCSYRDDEERIRASGVTLLGISPQDVDSHERWAAERSIPFPLLADTEKRVAGLYGVGAPILGVRRSVFLVDAAGIVRFVDKKLIGATFVDADTLLPLVAAL